MLGSSGGCCRVYVLAVWWQCVWLLVHLNCGRISQQWSEKYPHFCSSERLTPIWYLNKGPGDLSTVFVYLSIHIKHLYIKNQYINQSISIHIIWVMFGDLLTYQHCCWCFMFVARVWTALIVQLSILYLYSFHYKGLAWLHNNGGLGLFIYLCKCSTMQYSFVHILCNSVLLHKQL